jgi:hypothetical protein
MQFPRPNSWWGEAFMENIIAVGASGEAVPAPPASEAPGGPSGAEPKDAVESWQLWTAHSQAEAAAERGKEESRTICLELGRRLSEAKERLARPGRSGAWSSFVRSQGLPRAEADGLVRRYWNALGAQAGRADGCGGTDTATLLEAVGPHIQKALASGTDALGFITHIAGMLDLPHEQRQKGLLISNTAPRAEAGLAVPAPAPQPSGEVAAATDEPAAETAATPTEAVQSAEAACEVPGADAAPAPGGPGAAIADAGSPAVA